MASDRKKVYRTFLGFVKFPPTDSEIESLGVTVRNFVIRGVGVKDQAVDVRCTLWPSHEEFQVEEGDAVLVEGEFKVNKTKDKDGDPVTYFNLSVSRIVNLGPGFTGERQDRGSSSEPVDDDDDMAY